MSWGFGWCNEVQGSRIRSVDNRSTTADKNEQYAGIWTGEGCAAYAAAVAWVGLWWGDMIVAAALPAAYAACTVCGVVGGVVPGAAVAEAGRLNQRGSRWLPGSRRLYPC